MSGDHAHSSRQGEPAGEVKKRIRMMEVMLLG